MLEASTSTLAQPRLIQAGDLVIVYMGHDDMKAVKVDPKGTFANRYGKFRHAHWIGLPFGSKALSVSGSWVYLLAPTPELWSQVLKHRTQILYVADISMICSGLELRPGARVLESGTGSGSLTHSLARAVAPDGRVRTFEFHQPRWLEACTEFKSNGLGDVVECCLRDVEGNGFPDLCHKWADAIILDLPSPWKVVDSAHACLKPNGRICSFSPCIEQVQRTAEGLRGKGFTDLQCVECLLRYFDVKRESYAIPAMPTMPTPCKAAAQSNVSAAAAAHNSGEQDQNGIATAVSDSKIDKSADESMQLCTELPSVAASEGAAVLEQGEGPAGTRSATNAIQDASQLSSSRRPGGVEYSQQAAAPTEDGPLLGKRAANGACEGDTGGRKVARRKGLCLISDAVRVNSIVAVPRMNARGHTGFLLFARKPVACD